MHPVGRLCKLPRMTVLTSASYVKVMPRPGRPKNPQTFPPLSLKTPSPSRFHFYLFNIEWGGGGFPSTVHFSINKQRLYLYECYIVLLD